MWHPASTLMSYARPKLHHQTPVSRPRLDGFAKGRFASATKRLRNHDVIVSSVVVSVAFAVRRWIPRVCKDELSVHMLGPDGFSTSEYVQIGKSTVELRST